MTKNEPDLDGMSVAELTALISDAKVALEARRTEGLRSLIEEMAAKAEALGVTMADLIGSAQAPRQYKPKDRQDREIRYRGPNGETWSGVGRLPFWIKNAAGKTKKDFEVRR